jgi:transposase
MWAYARGAFETEPGVVFDFCAGRGGQYATEFLKGWSGTLVVDAYSGYDAALSLDGRSTAYCLTHARRKFDELVKANASVVAGQAIQRIAWLYTIEADARLLTPAQRLRMRQQRSQPLWDEMHVWLQLERTRVPDGSAIAKAIDYSLKHWGGLGRFLLDGAVPIDNNHVENRIRPWALGRRNWLFIGSQLAGERAAVVMSLLQSAKLNGHEPWAYLKDVLTRLPTQLNSRIEELLPHKWRPAG